MGLLIWSECEKRKNDQLSPPAKKRRTSGRDSALNAGSPSFAGGPPPLDLGDPPFWRASSLRRHNAIRTRLPPLLFRSHQVRPESGSSLFSGHFGSNYDRERERAEEREEDRDQDEEETNQEPDRQSPFTIALPQPAHQRNIESGREQALLVRLRREQEVLSRLRNEVNSTDDNRDRRRDQNDASTYIAHPFPYYQNYHHHHHHHHHNNNPFHVRTYGHMHVRSPGSEQNNAVNGEDDGNFRGWFDWSLDASNRYRHAGHDHDEEQAIREEEEQHDDSDVFTDYMRNHDDPSGSWDPPRDSSARTEEWLRSRLSDTARRRLDDTMDWYRNHLNLHDGLSVLDEGSRHDGNTDRNEPGVSAGAGTSERPHISRDSVNNDALRLYRILQTHRSNAELDARRSESPESSSSSSSSTGSPNRRPANARGSAATLQPTSSSLRQRSTTSRRRSVTIQTVDGHDNDQDEVAVQTGEVEDPAHTQTQSVPTPVPAIRAQGNGMRMRPRSRSSSSTRSVHFTDPVADMYENSSDSSY